MQKRNIVWLASYPKSGNTWFRAFLTALLGECEDIDINGLKTQGIFSSRDIFNAFTDLDSAYLYNEEATLLLPEVFMALSEETEKDQYIKIHNAYTLNSDDLPIIPSGATKCAIYIIRNPLDLVASFANHMVTSIDHAIKVMNNPKGSLAIQKDNHNTNQQFPQLMLSWSEHVYSWTSQTAFPVHVVRYEDMLNNSFETFCSVAKFMGIEVSEEKIDSAVNLTQFEKLQQKERLSGFREKNHTSPAFFRSGKAGNWKTELTRDQAKLIIDYHADLMKKYGYYVDLNDYFPKSS